MEGFLITLETSFPQEAFLLHCRILRDGARTKDFMAGGLDGWASWTDLHSLEN